MGLVPRVRWRCISSAPEFRRWGAITFQQQLSNTFLSTSFTACRRILISSCTMLISFASSLRKHSSQLSWHRASSDPILLLFYLQSSFEDFEKALLGSELVRSIYKNWYGSLVAALYTSSNALLSVIALFSSRTASRSFELRILNTNSAVAIARIVHPEACISVS